MANDKPGRDLIPGLWIKRLTSARNHFKQLLISIVEKTILYSLLPQKNRIKL